MQGKNLAFSASFGKAAGIGFIEKPKPFATDIHQKKKKKLYLF